MPTYISLTLTAIHLGCCRDALWHFCCNQCLFRNCASTQPTRLGHNTITGCTTSTNGGHTRRSGSETVTLQILFLNTKPGCQGLSFDFPAMQKPGVPNLQAISASFPALYPVSVLPHQQCAWISPICIHYHCYNVSWTGYSM